MWTWLNLRWTLVRQTIAAGDVAAFERRYLPAAILFGVVVGAGLSLLAQLLAVVFILAGGFVIGYAVRAYLSVRRRAEALRRRGHFE